MNQLYCVSHTYIHRYIIFSRHPFCYASSQRAKRVRSATIFITHFVQSEKHELWIQTHSIDFEGKLNGNSKPTEKRSPRKHVRNRATLLFLLMFFLSALVHVFVYFRTSCLSAAFHHINWTGSFSHLICSSFKLGLNWALRLASSYSK